MRILMAATRSDPASLNSSRLASYIADKLRSAGNVVTYYLGFSANRVSILRALAKRNHDLFLYVGHGEDDRLKDFLLPDPITTREAYLFTGTPVVALACMSANELGQRCVDLGCPFYYGHTGLAWVTIRDFIPEFAHPWESFFNILCKGSPVGDAVEYASNLWRACASSLRVSDRPLGDYFATAALANAQGFTLLGSRAVYWNGRTWAGRFGGDG